jgi:L-2,4-diaminobutyrate decarboxylase
MKEHFVDPATMDISDFTSQVEFLDSLARRYQNLGLSRFSNDLNVPFAKLLESESLPDQGLSLRAVFQSLASYTQGQIKWNEPGAMINVTPPPTIASVAAAAYIGLLNPNGAQDMSSGHLLMTELSVVKMLAELAGYDPVRAGGIFSFGGKSTNMHAIKHGIQRVDPGAIRGGVTAEIMAISSTQGHPCYEEAAAWLGIGERAVTRVECNQRGQMDLHALEQTLAGAIEGGSKIATIFANGGSTIQMAIDPIADIVQIRDAAVQRYDLDYVPHVHVDSVIGWIYLFFQSYDFALDPLKLTLRSRSRIAAQATRISEIRLADSFGVDFHKTGFAPYSSSVYITADKFDIFAQGGFQDPDHPIGGGGKLAQPYEEVEFGTHSPFQYTLELSRSLAGPVSAYVNLKMLGTCGYQELLANLYESVEVFRSALVHTGRFEVLNDLDSDGFVTLLIAHPDGAGAATSPHGMGPDDRDKLRALARYNYRFYLYLFEQQKLGRCRLSLDYSSGYHSFADGGKIGVLKAYPMSPYFTAEAAGGLAAELLQFLAEYDSAKDDFTLTSAPHRPRPLISR